jgi:hypothetical protein
MSISRGFRRLSLVGGLLGFLLVCLISPRALADWDQDDYIIGTVLIVGPIAVILLLGWAVAGFRSD